MNFFSSEKCSQKRFPSRNSKPIDRLSPEMGLDAILIIRVESFHYCQSYILTENVFIPFLIEQKLTNDSF